MAGSITVGQMMSHQAGLPFVDAPPTFDEVIAVDPVVAALARSGPSGSLARHGYHAVTYGWLAGELVRRVDGRRIGRYFGRGGRRPLGLDFWIGSRVGGAGGIARLEQSPPYRARRNSN